MRERESTSQNITGTKLSSKSINTATARLSSTGNITCAAYPLDYLDTISCDTGETQTKSALNLIAYGVSRKEGQRGRRWGGRGKGRRIQRMNG